MSLKGLKRTFLFCTLTTRNTLGALPCTPSSCPADTEYLSYNLTQVWNCLSGISIRTHRLRAQSYKLVPYFRKQSPDGPAVIGVPTTPSLGLMTWLRQLIKLKKTIKCTFLLDYHTRTARWKRCLGQVLGKGHRASMPFLTAPTPPGTSRLWVSREASLSKMTE